MAYLGLPSPEVLVRARRDYSPTSDPEDPHMWGIEIREVDDPEDAKTGLRLVWSCPRCRMSVRAEALVRHEVARRDEDRVKEMVVRRLLEAGREEGAKVHPRCSELRAVVEVMVS